MLHRLAFADVLGLGRPQLIAAPLFGRDSTAKNNWSDGKPVQLLAYRIPPDPTARRWAADVIDETLHVVHAITPIVSQSHKGHDLLVASYEGVSLVSRAKNGKWDRQLLTEGNQSTPRGNRGVSEVKQGKFADGGRFLATIEPWHGGQVVVSTPTAAGQPWRRRVIDERLRWGHAVWCADLDGDGNDEILVGVRDDLSDRPGERRGVRIYKTGDGARWDRHIVDEGGIAMGIATEDLAVADLTGTGRLDLVAVGRQTGNVRIYWNQGKS